MGSIERSKKRVQLWKKAIVHFSLCFVMGFFTGFAPTAKDTIISNNQVSISSNRSAFSPQSMEMLHQSNTNHSATRTNQTNHSAMRTTQSSHSATTTHSKKLGEKRDTSVKPNRLVIIVTPTSVKDKLRLVLLSRMANTLRLVPSPLLWVVVEQQTESSDVSELLRKTGIMYRHLVFKENFTDTRTELDYQRNIALNHIEHHKLSGIVHFAGLSNVYDLSFFDEIRGIEVFGTWPLALLKANRKRLIIEGPVCDSSEVIGWHLKKLQNLTDSRPPIHLSSIAFNSSILWDPERWGRTSSLQDTSQDSLKFVRNEVLEEETKLKGIPSQSCSKVLLWNLDISRGISSHGG
ncbi:glycosyltransferase [Lithospermum erythrorhizon]|uniref:Glycosyltransferases n=1 Tax=Lithospermum erythrorhizon TaxID=34254 RepID=A0AAV3P9I7_LITER